MTSTDSTTANWSCSTSPAGVNTSQRRLRMCSDREPTTPRPASPPPPAAAPRIHWRSASSSGPATSPATTTAQASSIGPSSSGAGGPQRQAALQAVGRAVDEGQTGGRGEGDHGHQRRRRPPTPRRGSRGGRGRRGPAGAPPPGPARRCARPVRVTVRGIRVAASPAAHTTHRATETAERNRWLRGSRAAASDGPRRPAGAAPRRPARPQPSQVGCATGRVGRPRSRSKICVSTTPRGYSIAQQCGIDADPAMTGRASVPRTIWGKLSGRRSSGAIARRAGHVDRQPAPLRPGGGRRLHPAPPARPARRAVAAGALAGRGHDRPGRLRGAGRDPATGRLASTSTSSALDPEAPLTDPGLRLRQLRRPAGLPDRGGRPPRTHQGVAHRSGDLRGGAARGGRAGRAGLPGVGGGDRAPGPGPGAVRRRAGARRPSWWPSSTSPA